MQHLLQAKELTKDYGQGKGAFDINIDLKPGEIVGFIGPNGAGKSTVLNMLNGLLKPTKGYIQYFEKDYNSSTFYKINHRLGILLSEVPYQRGFTARKILAEASLLLGMKLKTRYEELAKYLELNLDQKFGKQSLGNQKKIGMIVALMHEPDVVLMDEPTSGLDPLIRQKSLSLFQEVKSRGGSIILSSHTLSEVQTICDRIIMIKDGKIILEDSTKNVLDKAQKLFRLVSPSPELVKLIQTEPDVTKVVASGTEIKVYTDNVATILDLFIKHNYFDFYLERPTLEETFINYYI
jgi:ABC-2 type transport system ATP-binding protein